MKQEDKERAKQLAQQHWEFLEPRYRIMFEDGFVHGYKHAVEDKEIKKEAKDECK